MAKKEKMAKKEAIKRLKENDDPYETVAALSDAFAGDPQIQSLINQLDARVADVFAPIISRAEENSYDWEDIIQDMSWRWAEDISNYYIHDEIYANSERLFREEDDE